MTIPALLQHTDFPFWRETFATARGATSHLVDRQGSGVYFRKYGRNAPFEYTFMGADHEDEVVRECRDLLAQGHRLKSLTFTKPTRFDLPTAKAAPDYRVAGDFDTELRGRSKKTQQTMRRLCRDAEISFATPFDKPTVMNIFNTWCAWATTRHFMVFKGHYRRWLDLYFEPGRPQNVFLYIIDKGGYPAAIFGGEYDPATKEAQVHIAKHTPDIDGKAMWIEGLWQLQLQWSPSVIHCGSTADRLKLDLGMEPHPAWALDVKKLAAGEV